MSRILAATIGALVAVAAASFGSDRTRPLQDARLQVIGIRADACAFTPSAIGVDLGDRVRLTLTAVDGPHSLVIDAYRIMKLAAPGHPATAEFIADQPGTFAYYSTLTSDADCPNMRGDLVVR